MLTWRELVKLAPSRCVLPVIEGLLFEDGTATATDLERTLVCSNSFEVNAPIVVPKDVLGKIPKSMDIKSIQVQGDRGKLVTTTGLTIEFEQQDRADNFPTIQKEGWQELPAITQELVDRIKLFKKLADPDEDRAAINCVYVGEDVVATNGHYLGWHKSPVTFEQPILIPTKFIDLIQPGRLYKLDGEYSDQAKLELDGGGTYYFGLSHNRFPDYKHVIPEATENILTSRVSDFTKALKEIIPFCDKQNQFLIKLFIDVAHTTFEGIPMDANGITPSKRIKSSNSAIHPLPLSLGFSADKMLTVLSTLPEGELEIDITGVNRAAIFSAGGEKRILMPRKLDY